MRCFAEPTSIDMSAVRDNGMDVDIASSITESERLVISRDEIQTLVDELDIEGSVHVKWTHFLVQLGSLGMGGSQCDYPCE